MASAGASYKQDMPPEGGYGPIRWMKQQSKKGMSGFAMFATYIGLTSVGIVGWYFQAQYWKRNRREMQDARIAVQPLVYAEMDRLYLKRLRANRDEENELMKDVPGWKTGTLYGQPVYHNLRNRFIEPSHKEFLAHINWHEMFDILYERRKH